MEEPETKTPLHNASAGWIEIKSPYRPPDAGRRNRVRLGLKNTTFHDGMSNRPFCADVPRSKRLSKTTSPVSLRREENRAYSRAA